MSAPELREDFQRLPVWLITEAAHYSGLSLETVRTYIKKPQRLDGGPPQFRFITYGRGKRARGAVIDAASFLAWFKTREPQGPFDERQVSVGQGRAGRGAAWRGEVRQGMESQEAKQ